MKRHLPLVLLLCICLVAGLLGCDGTNPGGTTVPTTDAPTTVPTTAPPDPAEIYLTAVEALGTDAVGMEITLEQTMTVAGQTFTLEDDQTVGYWNIGTEEFLAQVEDTADLTQYAYTFTEVFGGGSVYQTINDCNYTAAMEAEDYTSRYLPLQLLDPSLYEMALEEGNTVIRFTNATALESWIADEDAVLNSAEATVKLGSGDTLAECTYTVDYTYGPARYEATYTVTYTDPGEAPALPENTDDYHTLENIDGIWLLDHAYGYLYQAKQYSSSILSSVQSQAAGLMVNTQYTINAYPGSKSGTDYRLETNVFAMDASGEYEQELDEKFIGGKYTASIDDGNETTNSSVTRTVMEEYVLNELMKNIFDTSYLTGATVTDLGSLYLVEFTCSEDLALAVCEDFSATYLGQADLLSSLASAYTTNTMDYYVALDKYTMLPTSVGYQYEGVHTIEGYDYILMEQVDQSFDLASLTAYEAIYDETTPDTEPENKPTPLFYKVTGPEGQLMWLFGTIHVGDDRTGYLPQEIYDALLSSDALAVECDTEGFEEAVEEDEDLQAQVSECYFYSDGTVADHLDTEDLHEYAVQVMKATGSYFYNSEYQKAALWSSSIDNYYLSQGRGLVREKGIESRLEEIADENDIPLWEVESSLFQVKMLTGYSDYLQEFQLYSSAYSHGKEVWESTQELYELWCAGDEAALIEEMAREPWSITEEDLAELEAQEDLEEEDLEDIKNIRENLESINTELEKIRQEYVTAMESDRNAGMLEVAKDYLESGDTVFYAVGLAHLLAEDGLVFTLREAGYTVELVTYG